MTETVDEKVAVLFMDEASMSLTSFSGLAGLTFGEAGWKRVGGRSFGNSGGY